jgi:ribonuclease HI
MIARLDDSGMISVYADGSSHSSGGRPGGWAFLVLGTNRSPMASGAGGHPETTNNAMELTAIIRGLYAVRALWPNGPDSPLEVVSDSQYALGMASGSYSPTRNQELVAELRRLVLDLHPRLRWVRGHNGDKWNERVDSLAKLAKNRLVQEKA